MRFSFRKVPTFFIVFIKLFLLEFICLALFRIAFFLIFKHHMTSDSDIANILKAFFVSWRFDMVTSLYALYMPLIWIILNEWFEKKTKWFHLMGYYTSLILFSIFLFISVADFPYFNQFQSHLNKQALLWNDHIGFAIRLILGNIAYYGYFFLFLFLAYIQFRIIRIIFLSSKIRSATYPSSIFSRIIFIIILIPFIIMGSRGRLSFKSSTHEGLAIVSEDNFINQIALNPNFTFFRSIFYQKNKTYKVPDHIDESILFARNYLNMSGPYSKSIERTEKTDSMFKPYNVVIICMESMGSYKLKKQDEELTPHFNQIIKESVYFDRFFSSGIHTFNGLFSTCTGYPSMLEEQGLKRYIKQPFNTLAHLLLKKNYQTSFYCTHDPQFDNMEGFFKLNGYEKCYSSFDLPNEKSISVTGVPDHELFKLFIEKTNQRDKTKPFLSFIMTGSDHGPWAIPENIPFKPNAKTKENRSTQYADWALGQLIHASKEQDWFDNTLFVFLGDHGYARGDCYEMPLSYNLVPFVLYMPGVLNPDTIHHLGQQYDVNATIAGILNLNYNNTTFGSNILKVKHPFVYFTADDKIGCVSDDGYFYYELIPQKIKRLRYFETMQEKDYYPLKKNKADSLEQASKHMLNAAEYFIRQNYFSY